MIAAGAIVAALLSAAAPQAPPVTPLSEFEQALGRPVRPPQVPAELASIIAEAGLERLVVRGLGGEAILVPLGPIEIESFVSFGGGRFLGFSYIGNDHFGFTLVDRANAGGAAAIETGTAPAFAPDGRWFAAASISEGGFSGLEGVALWEVLPGRIARRFFTDAVPRAFDWRVDGWPRPGCAAISAVDIAWEPPAGIDYSEALPLAPRLGFEIEVAESEVALRSSTASAACGVEPDA